MWQRELTYECKYLCIFETCQLPHQKSAFIRNEIKYHGSTHQGVPRANGNHSYIRCNRATASQGNASASANASANDFQAGTIGLTFERVVFVKYSAKTLQKTPSS